MFSSLGKCGALWHPLFIPFVAHLESSCTYQQQNVSFSFSHRAIPTKGGLNIWRPSPSLSLPHHPPSQNTRVSWGERDGKGGAGAWMDTETRTPALCYLAFSYIEEALVHIVAVIIYYWSQYTRIIIIIFIIITRVCHIIIIITTLWHIRISRGIWWRCGVIARMITEQCLKCG